MSEMESVATTGTSGIYGTFYLDDDEYAIEMEGLQEVVDAPSQLQRMPLAPPFLVGLYHLRGRVLPVADLRTLLKLPPAAHASDTPRRMAVIKRDSACVGVLFDRLGEVLRLKPEDRGPIAFGDAKCGIPVKAVICREDGEHVVQVLDFEAILSIRNLPAIERGGHEDEAALRMTHRMRDLYRDKLIGFTVGGCSLALEMKCVNSIMGKLGQLPSPRKSSLCETIVMLQGVMVPVVKMAKLFHLEENGELGRLLICRIGGELIAFEVDDVTSIIPYSKERILPIPVLHDFRASVFQGSFTDREGKDFIVLDENGLLTRPEISEIALGHQRLATENQGQGTAQRQDRGGKTSLLTFRVGRLYGLKLTEVTEVLDWRQELARTPDTPPAVLGFMNLRGAPIPVLDPRVLFQIDHEAKELAPKILVFQEGGRKIGMRVDSLDSIISTCTDGQQELPELFFRDEKGRFEESFSKGIEVAKEDGQNTAVVVLHATQIIQRLSNALVA
ncbi:chemotaxis protein CheW [Bryobacter aggregatus]|uniref:chemotaxis protein CheW n=1 Tax=Bryobacter aggregatus TaxID=360054 RepID=UPI0004E1E052|nr:chemotaxis protein CheW [Bryobacter aggregatus]